MVLDTTYVANNATEAAQKLATYGFVVLEKAVPYHVLDALAAQIHDDFAFYQRQPYLNREENLQPGCLPQRFCLNHCSNWRKPAWQDFVREILQGMTGEVVNEVFLCKVIDTIGGDVVCSGFRENQPLHEDWPSCPTRAIPMTLSASVALIPIVASMGAMRIIPDPWRRAGGFLTPPGLAQEPAEWRAAQLEMPKGSVLLRDVNTWHGGCMNISEWDRVLPAVRFIGWHTLHKLGHRPSKCLPSQIYNTLEPIIQASTWYLWHEGQEDSELDEAIRCLHV